MDQITPTRHPKRVANIGAWSPRPDLPTFPHNASRTANSESIDAFRDGGDVLPPRGSRCRGGVPHRVRRDRGAHLPRRRARPKAEESAARSQQEGGFEAGEAHGAVARHAPVPLRLTDPRAHPRPSYRPAHRAVLHGQGREGAGAPVHADVVGRGQRARGLRRQGLLPQRALPRGRQGVAAHALAEDRRHPGLLGAEG